MSSPLPERCPGWCIVDHVQALAEGCTAETASYHRSGDFAGRLDDIANAHSGDTLRPAGNAGWRLELWADHVPPFWGYPTIDLEVSGREPDVLAMMALTSGEARVLARQLIHFADLLDLDH